MSPIKRNIIFFIIGALLLAGICFNSPVKNIASNPGFENEASEGLYYWTKHALDVRENSVAFHTDNRVKHGGDKSVCITNKIPNYTAYKQRIMVEPNCVYRLSCWLKTENVGPDDRGADLLVEGLTKIVSGNIRGTQDWKQLTLRVKTGPDTQVITVSLELGGINSLNTGKVWFDDFVVEKFMLIPFTPPGTVAGMEIFLLLFTALFFVAFYYIIVNLNSGKNTLEDDSGYRRSYWYLLLGTGFLLRLVLAPIFEGHLNDVSCFSSWAIAAAKGLKDFYQNGISGHYPGVDYPPFYIYVLKLIGKLMGAGRWADLVLLKFPAILADLLTVFLIYRFSRPYFHWKMRLALAGLYLFNPAVLLNSTVWGQVDSVFTVFIVAALIMLAKEKMVLSSVFFALAVLMKPQGLIFLPVLFFELIRRKKAGEIILSAVCSLAVTAVIVWPFSGDPFWIIKQLLTTAGKYPFAALNAFNLFALLGGNMVFDSKVLFILSYEVWGYIFIGLITILSLYIYIKGRAKTGNVNFMIALLLITGVFVLSIRMHERYLFPVAAISMLAYVQSRDIRILLLNAFFTIAMFINNFVVLFYVEKSPSVLFDSFMIITSLINIFLLGYTVKIALNVAEIKFRNNKSTGITSVDPPIEKIPE